MNFLSRVQTLHNSQRISCWRSNSRRLLTLITRIAVAGTDAYSFNVVYTSASGDRFVEAVTLNVTDSNEEFTV